MLLDEKKKKLLKSKREELDAFRQRPSYQKITFFTASRDNYQVMMQHPHHTFDEQGQVEVVAYSRRLINEGFEAFKAATTYCKFKKTQQAKCTEWFHELEEQLKDVTSINDLVIKLNKFNPASHRIALSSDTSDAFKEQFLKPLKEHLMSFESLDHSKPANQISAPVPPADEIGVLISDVDRLIKDALSSSTTQAKKSVHQSQPLAPDENKKIIESLTEYVTKREKERIGHFSYFPYCLAFITTPWVLSLAHGTQAIILRK